MPLKKLLSAVVINPSLELGLSAQLGKIKLTIWYIYIDI